MHPGPLRDALTLLVGVATGTLSAAFGVGGAVLSTPGIRALGASAYTAVGTTLPSMLPSAALGGWRYAREGLVRWWAVAVAAPIGVVTAIGGSLLSHVVPGNGHWLMLMTAGVLVVSAARMGSQPEPPALAAVESDAAGVTRVRLRDLEGARAKAALSGLASGLMSGLLGIGGGTVLVPAFTELLGMPTKSAIATSLVCVGIYAVPGTITHAALGDIDWRFALLLTAGVIPGARVGAAITLRTADRHMRRIVAIMLGAIALVYAVGELIAALD